MALTLNATPGDPAANTYCTIAEADTYHETHVYGTDWVEETNGYDADKKAQALVWATRLLDEKLTWLGSITDEDQALGWPRDYVYDKDGREVDETTIPQFLKNATAEFARLLVAEDRTAEPDTAGFKWIKLGTLGMGMDKNDRRSVLPPSVYSIVKFYAYLAMGQPRVLERI